MRTEDGRSRKKQVEQPRYWRWVIHIFLMAVVLSGMLSLFSGTLLSGAGYVTAVLILIFFVLLGIVFDVIGVAVTAASPSPFHSMASHRTKGAKESLFLLRNSEKVASFCNDVVGDICGIVSGSTAAVLVVRLQQSLAWENVLISTAVTALISGLTIGGKAVGKKYAMERCKEVVYSVGKVLHVLHIGNK